MPSLGHLFCCRLQNLNGGKETLGGIMTEALLLPGALDNLTINYSFDDNQMCAANVGTNLCTDFLTGLSVGSSHEHMQCALRLAHAQCM